MRSSLILVAVLAAAISASRCGGGGGSTTTPAASTPATVTVNIVASAGNTAFNPNPVSAATGSMVVWKNNTADLHHLVMDDSAVVIGDIAPGASSTPIAAVSGNYHCTNHPSMVGSINGAVAPTPPPGSGPGY